VGGKYGSTGASPALSHRGPWLEYTLAAPIYLVLAILLHFAQRPILFWLCVLFSLASTAGAFYLLRSRATA
jgi:hypothetical protein